MADDSGPWKRQWHPFVEGMESLGGAEFDFIDIEEGITGAPKTDEVNLIDLEYALTFGRAHEDGIHKITINGDERESVGLAINQATRGMLIRMLDADISEAAIVLMDLDTLEPQNKNGFLILDASSFETPDGAEFIPDIERLHKKYIKTLETVPAEESNNLQLLADTTVIARKLTYAIMLSTDNDLNVFLTEVLDSAQESLLYMSFDDHIHAALQQMIEDLRPPSNE